MPKKEVKKIIEEPKKKFIIFAVAIILVILLTVGLAFLIKNLSSKQPTNNPTQTQQKNEPRPIIITGKIVQVAQDKIIINDRKNKRTEIFFDEGIEPKITSNKGNLTLEDLKTNQDVTVYAKEKNGVVTLERIRTKDQSK